jgi:hypothetical protein
MLFVGLHLILVLEMIRHVVCDYVFQHVVDLIFVLFRLGKRLVSLNLVIGL